MKNEKINAVTSNFERGFYMLCWFTNPDKNTDFDIEESSPLPIENSLATQFYTSLELAHRYATALSGNRVIFQMIGQNPDGGFMQWSKVAQYGESFDLYDATFLDEEYRLIFEQPEKEFPKGTIG